MLKKSTSTRNNEIKVAIFHLFLLNKSKKKNGKIGRFSIITKKIHSVERVFLNMSTKKLVQLDANSHCLFRNDLFP